MESRIEWTSTRETSTTRLTGTKATFVGSGEMRNYRRRADSWDSLQREGGADALAATYEGARLRD
ncbi:MAG: hypothetical protein ABI442_11290, partial [Gemmatimonadaceae bacterium]